MASLLRKTGATAQSVNTDWRRSAGDFSCTLCLQKRLPAAAFSKTQVALALKNHRTNNKMEAKCKVCTAAAAKQIEQQTKTKATTTTTATATALAKTFDELSVTPGETALITCSSCDTPQPSSKFTNSQKTKISRGKKGRCKDCVAHSEAAEVEHLQNKREEEQAAFIAKAKKTGGVAGRLALACAETATEAAVVTGIKIKKGRASGGRWRGGRGGRRGRGGGRGRGRGK